jgi:hypothetical protein
MTRAQTYSLMGYPVHESPLGRKEEEEVENIPVSEEEVNADDAMRKYRGKI